MIRLILRLYPRAWREQYGHELLDLIAAEGMRPTDVLDLLRAAAQARFASMVGAKQGGEPMTLGVAWRHPTAWALVGFVLLLPTGLFVTGSLAAFQLGAAGLQEPMRVIGGTIDRSPALVVVLLAAPVLALAAATLPLLHLSRGPAASESVAIIGIRLRRMNIAVITVALALAAILVWYSVGEMLTGGSA